MHHHLLAVPGTRSVFYERNLGGLYIDIVPDREALARYGLTVADVQDVIEAAVGGMPVSTVIAGRAPEADHEVMLARELSDTTGADIGDAVDLHLATRESMLASQLDADRFDYLLRDNLMTGSRYGDYDLEWLLHALTIDESTGRLAVTWKGISAVEAYLQSRYHMYRNVYFHKVVRSAEGMVKLALQRAKRLAVQGRLEWPSSSPGVMSTSCCTNGSTWPSWRTAGASPSTRATPSTRSSISRRRRPSGYGTSRST